MLAAPLLAGNDLRTATPAILEILMNPEVIAIDQDKLGKQSLSFVAERRAGNLGARTLRRGESRRSFQPGDRDRQDAVEVCRRWDER